MRHSKNHGKGKQYYRRPVCTMVSMIFSSKSMGVTLVHTEFNDRLLKPVFVPKDYKIANLIHKCFVLIFKE